MEFTNLPAGFAVILQSTELITLPPIPVFMESSGNCSNGRFTQRPGRQTPALARDQIHCHASPGGNIGWLAGALNHGSPDAPEKNQRSCCIGFGVPGPGGRGAASLFHAAAALLWPFPCEAFCCSGPLPDSSPRADVPERVLPAGSPVQSRASRFDPVAGSQLPIDAGIMIDGQQPVENSDSEPVEGRNMRCR